MNELQPYPKTYSGQWKRKFTDELESISKTKYCTSCNTLRPLEQVKIYRGGSGIGVPRCDTCQSKRLAYMKGRK